MSSSSAVAVAITLTVYILPDVQSQYIQHTLCAQLHRGSCRERCFDDESNVTSPFGSLCRDRTCCINSTLETVGRLSPWSAWSSCTASCGQGSANRSRTCVSGRCSETLSETRPCLLEPCESDLEWGVWSVWGDWTSCSKTCGEGLRFRYRKCRDNRCPGRRYQRQICSNNCNIDAVDNCTGTGCNTTSDSWNPWGEWGECSKSCGFGVRIRYRTCNGTDCVGPTANGELCSREPCPAISQIPGSNQSAPETPPAELPKFPSESRDNATSVGHEDTDSNRRPDNTSGDAGNSDEEEHDHQESANVTALLDTP